jgi:hypothetical protein
VSDRSCAAATIALASGCSLSDSTAAASASSSFFAASTATSPVTRCWPRVSVPVLSNSTMSTWRIRSQGGTVPEEDAAARRERSGDRDHQRDGEPKRMRTGDHKHGDGPYDAVLERSANAQARSVIEAGAA